MGPLVVPDLASSSLDLYVLVSALFNCLAKTKSNEAHRYSTIRAKRIFLTTYYDAFEPALFAHIPKSDALQRASPSPSSVSSPFSVSDALFRSGLKGFLKESWSRVSAAAIEWQVQLWDAWRRDVRTTAWPPT